MKKIFNKIVITLFITTATIPAYSAIISVSGPLSSLGGTAEIISPPKSVNDDAEFLNSYNTAQQGFNEKQQINLIRDILVDGGSISQGTLVSSHMIFLNTGPGHDTTFSSHQDVLWTFDDIILGVMSNFNASYEVDSTDLLGSDLTTYPLNNSSGRGLDSSSLDSYSISGSSLTLSMGVTEPGDWIRVVTAAKIPEPTSILLMIAGLLSLRFKIRHQ